jgi:glycosyltransferase involved in cell wall biosynthesis
MRIVFISTMDSMPWGGSEELWSRAALQLCGQGHEISASVIWWPQLSPKVSALATRGIQLIVKQLPQHQSAHVRIWNKLSRGLGVEDQKVKWLRGQKPDLVVISQGFNRDGLEWMQRCRGQRLPYAAIIQCNSEIWWPADSLGNELAAAYRFAKKVFCVSRHNLELLENQIGEALPNAEVVWNPFNVSAAHPPACPETSGVWKIACVARLDPAAKGQDLLFQVLAQPQWRERPIEVNLYGSGPCEGNLRRMIERFGLKNVHLRGHSSDVRTIWEQNNLLVLPSRYEGLPLALVEAMWCGRPAVVTDVAGNAEICVDGETGFVAAAPTVKLLGEAMERAWNQRDQWSSLGQAARRRVEKMIPKDPVGEFCKKLTEQLHFK